jgi:hypothetical protein
LTFGVSGFTSGSLTSSLIGAFTGSFISGFGVTTGFFTSTDHFTTTVIVLILPHTVIFSCCLPSFNHSNT